MKEGILRIEEGQNARTTARQELIKLIVKGGTVRIWNIITYFSKTEWFLENKERNFANRGIR